MSTPPNFLDLPWRWQQRAGAWRLETDCATPRLLLSANYNGHLTTSEEGRALRLIDPSDDIAKIIASASEVRRHSRSLIHGINIGLFRIEADGDEMIADEVLRKLREALARSGAV